MSFRPSLLAARSCEPGAPISIDIGAIDTNAYHAQSASMTI